MPAKILEELFPSAKRKRNSDALDASREVRSVIVFGGTTKEEGNGSMKGAAAALIDLQRESRNGTILERDNDDLPS